MGSDDEQTSSKELPVLDHSLDGGVKLKASDPYRPNRATNKGRLMGHPLLFTTFLSVTSGGLHSLSPQRDMKSSPTGNTPLSGGKNQDNILPIFNFFLSNPLLRYIAITHNVHRGFQKRNIFLQTA